jgi:hypothetical protein
MKMESTENYVELVKESWKDLKKAVADGKFDPWRAEGDVHCFLYHCLVERAGSAKVIHSELQLEEGKRGNVVDLAIANKVFVDIKNILRSGKRTEGSWRSRMRDAKIAIERLTLFMEKYSAIGILAIYAHSYITDDDKWYSDVKSLCDDKGIMMLDIRDC